MNKNCNVRLKIYPYANSLMLEIGPPPLENESSVPKMKLVLDSSQEELLREMLNRRELERIAENL